MTSKRTGAEIWASISSVPVSEYMADEPNTEAAIDRILEHWTEMFGEVLSDEGQSEIRQALTSYINEEMLSE